MSDKYVLMFTTEIKRRIEAQKVRLRRNNGTTGIQHKNLIALQRMSEKLGPPSQCPAIGP